jgi:hypothetical protein
MATNWDYPGKDYPSKEDVRDMEREDRQREREYQRTQDRVDQYLKNHPSASYAEAEYKSRKN